MDLFDFRKIFILEILGMVLTRVYDLKASYSTIGALILNNGYELEENIGNTVVFRSN